VIKDAVSAASVATTVIEVRIDSVVCSAGAW